MRYSITLISISILLVCSLRTSVWAASSAQTSANATATVIASIGISKTDDLAFGNAAQGDNSLTIDPATQPGPSATFTVTGQANTAYDITLPSDGTIIMITDDGGVDDEKINVNSFTSNPSGSGNTGAGGSQTLNVGATRAAISASQVAGSYTASFNVTVAYQ